MVGPLAEQLRRGHGETALVTHVALHRTDHAHLIHIRHREKGRGGEVRLIGMQREGRWGVKGGKEGRGQSGIDEQ